jgi:3-hydroxybutyryl-CoA dehydrogenase
MTQDEAGPATVGVVGAGTMGSGIAQAVLAAGLALRLYDVREEFVQRGLERVRSGLARSVERGRLTAEQVEAALEGVRAGEDLSALADSELVIEAAPEDLETKRELFGRLGALLPDAVLASNTSSLSITSIAGAAPRPERVVGMHFFNPVHAMALVEVVEGEHTSPETLERTEALARALGKTPVRVQDTPGFIVNRVNRAFYGEALRLLGEGAGDVDRIDAAVREAGGFRMGPFELMDLIGIDVNYAVTRSVYDAYFGEPRFRPHPIQRRMVEAGKLGRKTGRGFYEHS